MKVVLFCGGLGLRLREYGESAPKPMLRIGYRPVLWHIMKFYAHFGHNDFVLCLGYRADLVKDYFLHYNEALSNDFVLSRGGREVELLSSDIDDWRITFADTGLNTNIGQRLLAARRYVKQDEVFLASYGDCLTDAPLDNLLEDFVRRGKVAAFLGVHAPYPPTLIEQGNDGLIRSMHDIRTSDIRINGGFFMFRREIFNYLREGEELVEEPFQRLITERQLISFPYDGFWAPMDTLTDRHRLQSLLAEGRPPWAVWERVDAGPLGELAS